MRALKLVGGVAVTLLVLAIALVVVDYLSAGGGPTADGATGACRDSVEAKLKSPGSAKWVEESARPTGKNEWLVTGLVDSENSFGASLRSQYGCTAHSDDGENWTTTNIGIAP